MPEASTMGYDLWEEGELMSLANHSLLAKLASTLDIDLEPLAYISNFCFT